jgi:hypothetical protein
MPLPAFPYIFRQAAAATEGPLAELSQDPESSVLGFPGLGRIVVTKRQIAIECPSSKEEAMLRARLGRWAEGQWLLKNDFGVLRGSAVERDGIGVLFLGGERVGATVTACLFVQRGWRLIADGNIAFKDDGVMMGGESSARLDTPVAQHLFPEIEQESVESGTDRRQLNFHEMTQDAVLSCYVTMGVSQGLTELSVTGKSELAWRPQFHQSAGGIVGIPNRGFLFPDGPRITVGRPTARDETAIQWKPSVVADRIAQVLGGILV